MTTIGLVQGDSPGVTITLLVLRGVKVVIRLSPIACLCAKRYSINFFRAINLIDVHLHFDASMHLRSLTVNFQYSE